MILPPSPDPIYQTDLELQNEIIEGKVFAEKFIQPKILPTDHPNEFWMIKNSTSIPFYTLYPLKDGFEWKDYLDDGYIPELKLNSLGHYNWYPDKGGWVLEKDKIPMRLLEYLAEKKVLSKSQDGTVTSILVFKISINKKITDLKIQVTERPSPKLIPYKPTPRKIGPPDDTPRKLGFPKLHYVFSGEPPPNLEIITKENDYPPDKYYLKIQDAADAEVLILRKLVKYEKELFQDVPKEYFPRERLVNNTLLETSCLEPRCTKGEGIPVSVIPIYSPETLGVWETWGLTNHQKKEKVFPEDFKIPPPEDFTMPCMYDGKICQIHAKLIWKRNESFRPFALIGETLASCFDPMCDEAINQVEKSNEEKGLKKSFVQKHSVLIKLALFPPFLFLIVNTLLFIFIKIIKKKEASYLRAIIGIISFCVLDVLLLRTGIIFIVAQNYYRYYWLSILALGLSWGISKWVIHIIFHKRGLIPKKKLLLFHLLTCLLISFLTVDFYF